MIELFLYRKNINHLKILILFSLIFFCFNEIKAIEINPSAKSDTALYLKNINYGRQIALYKLSKLKRADIVMLGNSLTHGANWNELLGRESVVEQGIVSDVIEGFYNRMKYVYKLHPKIVFILGGLNDIYNWVPVDVTFEYYIRIINGLKSRGIIPVIQLSSYATDYYGNDWLKRTHPEINVKKYNRGRNSEIDNLNRKLKKYARKHNIDLIDLNLKTRKGHFLKNEYSIDGVHFNDKGYKIWVSEINKILTKYGL